MFNKKYQRIFTIGCSFTQYKWPTWANVLATELNIPLYNLGKSGACNRYISSQLFQLEQHFKLTENDLVGICWSLPHRISKLGNEYYALDDNIWYTSGGWTTVNEDKLPSFKRELIQSHKKSSTYRTDVLNSLVMIKGSLLYQQTLPCDFFNLQLDNIIDNNAHISENTIYDSFRSIEVDLYPSFLSVMFPYSKSFDHVSADYMQKYTSLEFNWHSKYRKQHSVVNMKKVKLFYDWHPYPTEHVYVLEKLFDCTISNETKAKALSDEKKYIHNLQTDYELERNQILITLPAS